MLKKIVTKAIAKIIEQPGVAPMSPPSLCGYNVSLSTFEAASHCIHSGICDLLPPLSDLGVEASIVWYMSYADPPPRRGDPLMELEAASSRCPCSTLILRT